MTAPQPIVFEAKYCVRVSRYQAEKELAADAYQAFFYLLSVMPGGQPLAKRSGDYAYACLLACQRGWGAEAGLRRPAGGCARRVLVRGQCLPHDPA